MNAVNSGQMRESIEPAKVQHDHSLGLRILFVVGKARLHQQFFANEPGWRVTASQMYRAGRRLSTGEGIGVG